MIAHVISRRVAGRQTDRLVLKTKKKKMGYCVLLLFLYISRTWTRSLPCSFFFFLMFSVLVVAQLSIVGEVVLVGT